MKRILCYASALAIAAMAAASCSIEEKNAQDKIDDCRLVEVNFGAESVNPSTKATLTPNEGETAFVAAWENTDCIKIKYENDNKPAGEGIVDGLWNGSSFSSTLPSYKGMWSYDAVYPAYDENNKVDFGSARTQKGNAYNSAYDLMEASEIVENADQGKDNSGKDIVLHFVRKTAIAYFHFTSDNTEEITKATLSVEGGYISNSDVTVNESMEFAFAENTDADKSIVLTFPEEAPKADDFTLWFNVDPTDYTSMTLTVETANKTYTITKSTSGSYVAGRLYKVTKNDVEWEDGVLFYESFDKCIGANFKGGNDGNWSGSIASATLNEESCDNEGWIFIKGNAANMCAKLGTGSAKGSATTPAIIIPDGSATITFKAGAWSGDTSLGLNISASSGVLSSSSVTLTEGEFTDYSIVLGELEDNTSVKLTFEAQNESKNRFFLDEVRVVSGGSLPNFLNVYNEDLDLDSTETVAKFSIDSNCEWSISSSPSENVVISPISGTGDRDVSITVPENSSSISKDYTITVSYDGDKKKVLHVTQAPHVASIENKTIADFIEAASSTTNYSLTGTVSDFTSTKFVLTDNTGSITVYQCNLSGYAFSNGDIVSLYGKYSLYTPKDGDPVHEVVSGVITAVSIVDKISVSVDAITAAAKETAASFDITASEGVSWTISSSNDKVSVNPSSGTGSQTISVSFPKNTGEGSGTSREATITIASEGVYGSPCLISFTQEYAEIVPVKKGDVLWSENFSTTFAYGGAKVTKSYDTNSSVKNEKLAGGVSPELLLAKSGGTMTVSGIPTAGQTSMTLTFKSNHPDYVTVSSGTDGITVDKIFDDTWTISAVSSLDEFICIFSNTNSSNCRVDDFVLTAGSKSKQLLLFPEASYNATVGEAFTNPVLSGCQTTVEYQSSDTGVATVDQSTGDITLVAAGTTTITATAAETVDYFGASASYSLTVSDNGEASTKTVTYSVTSTKAASSDGTAPTGSSATYSQTYGTAAQATSGNSMTLTLKGYEGKTITGITMSMHSNSSKGAGKFSVVAGSTTLASIGSATNFTLWYNNISYGSAYRDVKVTLSNDSYVVGKSENVVINIECTTNSLYCQSYKISYK